MGYKDLFQYVIALLSSPGKAWSKISEKGAGRDILPNFVYPLIGLCGLSEFVGTLIGKGMSQAVFQIALTRCCAIAVALFGGYFLAAFLLDRLCRKYMENSPSSPVPMQVFVGYSMVVIFVLTIISGLVSIDLLHWLLQIYTIVVVFEGARYWLKVRKEKLTLFTVLATIIILLCPAVIEFVFNELSVILN
ncbi:Yip1 family protein [uncultured Bacteroides sp.]|uniref:Yip1 family protein n=1 Tax=uncultured Bacteroides sp. TaxID=162156 RepID=UPI0026052754|nr:Yip1 family protein [uncultured Bacteroides sp.]